MIQMTLPSKPQLLSLSIEPTELLPVQIDLGARLATGETVDSASCADGGRGIGNNVAVAGTSVQLDIAGLVNGTISLVVITALGDAGSIIRCVLVVHCIDPAHRIAPVVIPPTGALIMRGVYSAQAIYRQYDVVTQAGAPWFALVDAPASAPGVDANEWAPLSPYELSDDELAAIQSANSPTSENPFATILDLLTVQSGLVPKPALALRGLLPKTNLSGDIEWEFPTWEEIFRSSGAIPISDLLQGALAHRKFFYAWSALGTNNAGSDGVASLVASGTSGIVSPSGANVWTKKHLTTLVAPAVTALSAAHRISGLYVACLGNGFYCHHEVGFYPANFNSLMNFFAGLQYGSGIGSITNCSDIANMIGIGADQADQNLQMLHNDGVSGPATKIDLGPSFPKDSGSKYSIDLYAPNGGAFVCYRVKNILTGAEILGSVNTNLPAAWQPLRSSVAVNNGGQSVVACGFEWSSSYTESDIGG